ncbi:3-phosphoshikimate 1-carboxyvinyltransferase [Planctomycetes bacterium Pan216]|uniref:3-phosphoshikimate 1-carboxyvinyltransferase n=1 Tax=Kolteria novifilia TaxID=2527975 RepID=A0A518BA86_9BACT|nr:3-phosphoshikimate 1-carboxyvinyltransferase [Planctomycetes bacterium Pan216]
MQELSDELLIQPVAACVRGTVRPPGSKSYTNRALPIAALARGASRLEGLLDSEDTQVMMESLRRLGFSLTHRPEGTVLEIEGAGGTIPAKGAELYLANSGTSIRFLTAMVAVGEGTFRLDGVERMRERPIADLLTALRDLGVDARSVPENGCPPVIVEAKGLPGGTVRVKGSTSSQFLSALLIAAPAAQAPLTVEVDGELVSKPYIEMTLQVIEAFGAKVTRVGEQVYRFDASGYQGTEYTIEPDASAASYFFGAAAATAGSVTVDGLGTSSLQGDLDFVRVLERMGCQVDMSENSTSVTGGSLIGVDVDMGDISDTVPTLAAVACFAKGPTRIRNVAHVRVKETDRLKALATEIRKTGTEVIEHPDGLDIHPGQLQGATFDTYDDHRMAMSLALLGLRVPGVVIRNPGCTSKTYPDYFRDLATLHD